MIRKKDLLSNIGRYSPEEIAEAIKAGTVSLYELGHETEGAFTPLLKRRVKAILDAPTTTISATTSPLSEYQPLETNIEEDYTSEAIIDEAEDATLNETENTELNTADDATLNEMENTEFNDRNEETSFETMTEQEQQSFDDASSSEPITATPTPYTEETPSSTQYKRQPMFSAPFSFKGRIRRTEYCLSYLIFFVWAIFLNVATVSEDPEEGLKIFILLTIVPMYWFLWAQGCKRCHDRNNSGWFQLIPFYVFCMLFAPGVEEENEYGADPKGTSFSESVI